MISLDELKRFLEKYDYPADAQEQLINQYACILSANSLCVRMDEAETALFSADAERGEYLKRLQGVAETIGAAGQSIPLLCMMQAAHKLREKYAQAGVVEEIWCDTMLDLRTKAMECKKLDGVYGLFGTGTPLWLVNYFRLQRFALGRLQYEIGQLKADVCTVGGYTLRKGDKVLCCHIPSNGQPFDEETRLASYRAAHAFYRDAFADQYGDCVPITCDSWLLFPDHVQMLGERSNIARFMQEFMLLRVDRIKTHTNLWRIFDTVDTENAAALPGKTGLQRAYKERLLRGEDVGFGYGIFLFDGQRIINGKENRF